MFILLTQLTCSSGQNLHAYSLENEAFLEDLYTQTHRIVSYNNLACMRMASEKRSVCKPMCNRNKREIIGMPRITGTRGISSGG